MATPVGKICNHRFIPYIENYYYSTHTTFDTTGRSANDRELTHRTVTQVICNRCLKTFQTDTASTREFRRREDFSE